MEKSTAENSEDPNFPRGGRLSDVAKQCPSNVTRQLLPRQKYDTGLFDIDFAVRKSC